jgi:hypothetical protein
VLLVARLEGGDVAKPHPLVLHPSTPRCFDTFSRLRDTYIKTLRKYITGKTTLTAMRAEGELREALLGRPQPP